VEAGDTPARGAEGMGAGARMEWRAHWWE